MHVTHMVSVSDGGMSTMGAVFMGVVVSVLTGRAGHIGSSIDGNSPYQASLVWGQEHPTQPL
ncbi:hypothetical protein ACJJID_09510 [Microbulbifer sp. CnH-101-G]|uniref:hypothetical protein n=1 Tax=Microbulbifer sp. CnH-101-G TaxID=3243393 RepID=UPI00403999C8